MSVVPLQSYEFAPAGTGPGRGDDQDRGPGPGRGQAGGVIRDSQRFRRGGPDPFDSPLGAAAPASAGSDRVDGNQSLLDRIRE